MTVIMTSKYKCIMLCFTVGTDHGQEAIEHAAVFLFETFHNKDHVGTEETRAIKQMFGPFPSSAADASCACVGRLVDPLGDSRVEEFIQARSSRHNPKQGSTFGRNITFSYDCYTLDPLEDLPRPAVIEDNMKLDFTNFLNSHQSGRKAANEDEASGSGRSLSSADGTILRTEVDKYLLGGNMISSSPEELCTSLFEMLASHKSADELQNEVCVIGKQNLIYERVHSVYKSSWESFYTGEEKLKVAADLSDSESGVLQILGGSS